MASGRNRPLLAIQARDGLLRASMPANCYMLNGILRKSQSPEQDSFTNIFVQSAYAKLTEYLLTP